MAELWLIRHGETAWNLTGQHTGRTDLPLTERGSTQAKRLGRRLTGKTFALVLSSPLLRARETCRLAGRLAEAQLDDDLAEWDYGALEGRTSAEIRDAMPGWTIWTGPWPEGETPDEVGARADRVLSRALGAGDDVALFAHGHLLRILAARYLGLPAVGGRYLALDPASLSVLGRDRGERVLRFWNESYELVESP